MNRNLIGMYRDMNTAELVVKELLALGVPRNSISVVSHDASNKYRDLSTMSDKHREENALKGAGAGTVAGALGGALLSLGLAAIPGVGWILAAGPIGSILASGGLGAALGAGLGGLGGALSKVGVPERRAGEYAEAIRRGGTLVAIEADDTLGTRVGEVMERHNPIDIDRSSKRWRDAGWTGYDAKAQPFVGADLDREREHWRAEGESHSHVGMKSSSPETATREVRPPIGKVAPSKPVTQATTPNVAPTGRRTEDELSVPIVEEEIEIGKRAVVRGGTRIHTYPVVERVEQDVTLHEERVQVERRPVNRPVEGTGGDAFREQTYEFVERGEEAVVNKQARVVEEIHVAKTSENRTQHISETARHTEVEVEQLGAHQDFGRFEPRFREHFNKSYQGSGGNWEHHRHAYDFGLRMARDHQTRGLNREWRDVETTARSDWDRSPHAKNLPFDRSRDAIMYGYNEGRMTKV